MAAVPGPAERRGPRACQTASDPRRRLLAAAQRIVSERGPQAVTVKAVCAIAHVTPEAFRREFADICDCLLAVFDDVAEQARQAMEHAYRRQDGWVDGVRAALLALLELSERRPQLARFIVLDSLVGTAPLLARRAQLLADATRALEQAVPQGQPGVASAPFGAEAAVTATAAVLHMRLLEEPPPPLRELCGSLMAMIVLPYLGAGAAREQLSCDLPTSREPPPV